MNEVLEDQMGWKRAQRRLIVLLRCLLRRGRVEIKAGELQKGISSGMTHSAAYVGIYTTNTYGVPTRWLAQSQVWGERGQK